MWKHCDFGHCRGWQLRSPAQSSFQFSILGWKCPNPAYHGSAQIMVNLKSFRIVRRHLGYGIKILDISTTSAFCTVAESGGSQSFTWSHPSASLVGVVSSGRGGQPVVPLEGKTPVGRQAHLGGSKIHQKPIDTHGKHVGNHHLPMFC